MGSSACCQEHVFRPGPTGRWASSFGLKWINSPTAHWGMKYKNQYHSSVSSSKWSTMVRKRSTLFFITFLSHSLRYLVPVFALLPSLSSHSLHHHQQHSFLPPKKITVMLESLKFQTIILERWSAFQIIGGDLHYFRVLPEYWEDRLLRAKALGLNTIQTYVPWNLHEPRAGLWILRSGIWGVSLLGSCHQSSSQTKTSDPAFLQLVERWWGSLLPKVAPLLYGSGGPIIMVQIENEFGSYGDDKAYLHHLVSLARKHLGDDVILYTTDGGSRETLEKGTIRGDAVFSAVDFTTGDNPWPIFELQKEFNAPGKSPPLSSEFYTGWLTHWGEKNAQTSADFTAAALKNILERNGSAVLYMAHGGTNFGFYNGANAGSDESDYKPDLTSYDYDAPIRESGDVNNAKFKALRRVVEQYSSVSLPAVPSDNEKKAYGSINVTKTGNLFELIHYFDVVESDNPISMESTGQMFGFLLYVTEYTAKDNGGGSIVSIPKVHDRAQVFISCPSEDGHGKPTYVGTLERWSNQPLTIPNTKCLSNISLLVLVENMGRLNYGPYIFDRKMGILRKWKMYLVPIINLNESPKINPVIQAANSGVITMSARKRLKPKSGNASKEPAFYAGYFYISKEDIIKDTFISLSGGTRLKGPQCNLYVPAPVLQNGKNVVVIFELESPKTRSFWYTNLLPRHIGASNTMLQKLQITSIIIHFESFDSLDPIAAVAAAVAIAAAAPTLAPPAAFITPATLANAAIPPTSIALKATVGFTAISYSTCNFPLYQTRNVVRDTQRTISESQNTYIG
ncbi:beta-galactosidase 17 isoform X1 [Prunus yedoensis var. nudiflora]|uniref:Beta-galactosidase n=1 Tax=Prunus yedoensis var. nudiflora TaxID=2094558 RepID=A0A315A6S4_PRUYE|nr:beta-galactosidase 17 isoform X1 [Prunus yedoensis var. nudiflora]